jgi:hypothetical protein
MKGPLLIRVSRISFRHRTALLVHWRGWLLGPAVLRASIQENLSSAARDFLSFPRRWGEDGRYLAAAQLREHLALPLHRHQLVQVHGQMKVLPQTNATAATRRDHNQEMERLSDLLLYTDKRRQLERSINSTGSVICVGCFSG